MSHFTTLATEFVIQTALLKALADVGFRDVQVHGSPVALRGFLGDRRAQVAHIVIPKERVGRLSNDIGFLKSPDGAFMAIISDYDRHRYNEKWLGRLRQRYSFHATIEKLTEQGFELVDEVHSRDARISLTLRRLR